MEYEVVIRQVVEQPIVAARQRTTFAAISREIRTLLNGPWAFLKEHPEEHPGLWTDGHNVAVYRDMADGGSIEVGVQVTRPFEGSDVVVCSATPGGTVASTIHYGPYSELGPAHEAVMNWCRQHGHETVMPFWEIYGDWEDDPTKLRTDVLYLLK
jgi:effector-binding domain-containing protein